MISRLIDNEHIESISKLDNGHFLLVIKESSRMKLSRFVFDDNIKYSDPYYNPKGWLELFDFESVKLFLEINKRHLSAELCKSILDTISQLPFNPNDNSTKLAVGRLSLFVKTNEKLSLDKLKTLKRWTEHFSNPKKYIEYSVFDDIFRIMMPFDKRKPVEGSSLCEPIVKDGIILNKLLYSQIGLAYKKYHDFVSVCSHLSNWSNQLEKLSKEPEVLGSKWDVLNDDNQQHLKLILDWLQLVISTKKNPVDGCDLSDSDINQLIKANDVLSRSYDMLNNDVKKSFVLV